MKNKTFILFATLVCCMVLFCFSGIFGQGVMGEYPGAGVGFDAGCGYPDAGNNDPGVTDIGLTGNCGNLFDVSFGTWTESGSGFDIGGFTLSNYDIDSDAVYGLRLFYGSQDQCGTICLDAVIDLGQGQACGTFGPQASLVSFGFPVPAMFSNDIFGGDLIPYSNMCPNTEYFAEYQFVSTTSNDLSDPDGNFCALDDATIVDVGTMSTIQTLVAPGMRDPITINAATFVPVEPAVDCASTDVLFELTVDVTSGCQSGIGQLSKGLEVEVRGPISCTNGTTISFASGPIINDPTACITGTAGTNELPDQAAATTVQISLGSADDICAILACNPDAVLEVYATHTFCEADDINGDGTGVDEAIFPISLSTILAAYGDAGAMCCQQTCDEFDNILLFTGACDEITLGIGWQTDGAGVPLSGATEDPANYSWTVNSSIAGTQTDNIGFFDTDGDGTGDFLGNIITYTADQLAQGCAAEAFPTTVDVLCPDGTVAVLNLAAGPANLMGLDAVALFGASPLLYPDPDGFMLSEISGGCGMAPSVTITAADGTICFTETGTAPAEPPCDSGTTNSSPLDYDQTFGDSSADPLISPANDCAAQFTGTVPADCAAELCPSVCPDITALLAGTTDVCTGDNITVTLTLGITEGGEIIQVNGQDPDSGAPIAAGLTSLTYTIVASANTGCASSAEMFSVTTATCADGSMISNTSTPATVNVFPATFTAAPSANDGSAGCGIPSIDLVAADGSICESIAGTACVNNGDAFNYDLSTAGTFATFPDACIPTSGLTGTLTCAACSCTAPPSADITEPNIDLCDDGIGVATFNYSISNGPATITTTGTGTLSTTSLADGMGTFIYTPSPGETFPIAITVTIADPDGAGPCVESSDMATVTLIVPIVTDAGVDVTATCTITDGPPNSIALSATGTGMWSGGMGTFSSVTDPTATYMPATAEAGSMVTLTWTVTGTSPCPDASDDVIVSVEPCPGCTLMLEPEVVACVSTTLGTDDYTVTIPFDNGAEGFPGSMNYTITTTGTVGGDNPMLVQSGNIVLTFTEGTNYSYQITGTTGNANEACDIIVLGNSPACDANCTLTLEPEVVACVSTTLGTDDYTVTIPFDNGAEGFPGSMNYTITTTGTVGGDNPMLVQSGNIVLTFTEGTNYSYQITGTTGNANEACDFTVSGNSPACEGCAITPDMAANIQCNDSGTPADPTDDTYTFSITVNGNNPAVGASNTFNDDQGNTGIAYGTMVNYGPYPISGGNIIVNFTDADDAACTAMMMAAAPPTCSVVCEDDIAGTISLMGCDFTGTVVSIFDSNGMLIGTTMANANGNYALTGPFPCGSYVAELSSVPQCYTDEGGSVGPGTFIVNGDGIPDGFDFSPTSDSIPTVSEWGLIMLSLLICILAILHIRQYSEKEVIV